ncbi:MAG: hypothetical protein JSS74_15315 [Actinobacteria bacterium]|nr:hypothetical protein [Actinomycetota bacterium]
MSRRQIDLAVSTGLLRRARRDVYLSAAVDERVFHAHRVGGRLDCVAALELLGVYVQHRGELHVQVDPTHGRLRSPNSRRRRRGVDGDDCVVHWRRDRGDAFVVDPISALVQSFACQEPRHLVATLDSALFKRVIDRDDLAEIFERVPRRFRRLRRLVDGRAESGPESLARLLLRQFGRRIEVQRWIDDVGRVDLVVDGWIVVECDSREFHSGWEMQEADRMRDLALAARGYASLRPTANSLFTEPEILVDAVRGLLARGR